MTNHRRNYITKLTLTNVYLYCYFVLLTPKNLCGTVGIRGRGGFGGNRCKPCSVKKSSTIGTKLFWTFTGLILALKWGFTWTFSGNNNSNRKIKFWAHFHQILLVFLISLLTLSWSNSLKKLDQCVHLNKNLSLRRPVLT